MADYPIVKVPLEKIRFFAEGCDPAPHGRMRRICHENEGRQSRIAGGGALTTMESCMRQVFKSLLRIGMINPLIVKEAWANGYYYVMVGNQRLTALRAIYDHRRSEFDRHFPGGKIRCRVAKDGEKWGDFPEPRLQHPYEEVSDESPSDE